VKWSWRIGVLLALNAAAVAAVPLLLSGINGRAQSFAPSLLGAATEDFGFLFLLIWAAIGAVVGLAQVRALRQQPGWPGLVVATLPLIVLVGMSVWRLSQATSDVAKAQGYYVYGAAGLAVMAMGIVALFASGSVLVALWHDSRAVQDRAV